jgi:hypothetical protein
MTKAAAKAAAAAAAKAARAPAATPAPRTAVASREPPPPPPPPPAPAPKKKGDSLLDGIDGGGDDALSAALGGGGGSSGRSVYVPPKPGGSAALPDQVSDGQITEAIKGKFDSLATCGERTPVDGVVVMRWGITPEGGTRDIKCAAPCASQPLAGCLTSVIKGIRFPRSVNGRSRVEFPFKF